LDNLRYYHQLRNTAPLSRRPQLTISWTLKRNNVKEVPDFVRRIAEFEPDLISLRHLVVFQDKERSESLLDYPDEANAALSEAYAEMDRLGIRHESPPLMMAPEKAAKTVIPIRQMTSHGVQETAPDSQAQKPIAIAKSEDLAPVPIRTRSPQLNSQVPAPEPMSSQTWDRATSIALREPECNWMHRTAIIMADGEVITCGKHYGEQVGHLNQNNSLWDLWNGPRMHSLRAGFGTSCMWDQCKDCWLRELKWHSQRQAKDLIAPYSLANTMDYSEAAWDYRRYSEL
jgi:radical SAM protein with 4Fe4S-binding SPASM domain